jgi:signal transduction histidine kinase
VQLEITYAPDHVLIYVDDDGPGAPAGKTASSGHGLVGMQERVAAVGGTLAVGPRDPGPGWRVHARIPVVGVIR